MKLLKLTSVLLLAGASLTTVAASEYDTQVKLQLLEIETELEGLGYTLDRKYTLDTLNEDSTQTHTYYFESGTEYYIVGACDVDCVDIDMWLYDENGNEIDEDESDDDMPVLIVTPKWDGVYYIETKMYDCSDEPCSHGHLIMSD